MTGGRTEFTSLMLSKDEAELLVRAELKGRLPTVAPTAMRFEARLTSRGWKFATGDAIRQPGSRAQGLVRRGGWEFIYDLEEEYRQSYIEEHGRPPSDVMEFFPSLLVVRVYDDNCQVEEDCA